MEKHFPTDYRETIRAAVIVSIVYQATGFLVTSARKKYFNAEFMERHFGEQHRKYFGENPPVGGYPDPGDGKYADQLSFEGWHSLNSAVRAFNNFTEWIVSSVVSILLFGLFEPKWASYLGYIIAIGRALYAAGYLLSPGKRMIGAVISEVAVLVNLIAMLYCCLTRGKH